MDGLAGLRRNRGFSQRTLAKAAGVSPSTIYALESGTHAGAHPSTAKKLAEAMGVEVADILGALESPKAPAPPSPETSFNDILAEERRREELDIALSKKLHQQLDAQLKALRERRTEAETYRDHYEAENYLHHWWLFTYDWLTTFFHTLHEDRGPRLAEAMNRVSQVHKAEVTKDAPSPRDTSDGAEASWEVPTQRHIDD